MQGESRPSCAESLLLPSAQVQPLNFLSIISPKDKPWDVHKLQSEQIAEVLLNGLPHHQRKAARMMSCAENLEFGWSIETSKTGLSELKLKNAWFCRNRECPTCQWRRALMWVSRFYRAFPKIYDDHPEWRYVMLTLTVRNCPVLELRQTIRAMNSAWDRLIKRKIWPAVGFVRALEITRGKDGSAHPHFHCLIAVPPGYFAGKNYLSTVQWATLWQEALRVDYTPICDVRTVKPKTWEKLRRESPLGVQKVMMDEVRTAVLHPSHYDDNGSSKLGGPDSYDEDIDALQPTKLELLLSAVTEVIKYALKPDDMLADPDWLYELSDQLRNARAVALGGELRRYLSEEDPGNLITEDEEGQKENPGGIHFGWREDPRYAQYKRKRDMVNPPSHVR